MQNLLIAGGAGFIGANFVHHLLATYPTYQAIVFDKLTYAGNPNNLNPVKDNPRYHFVQGDICDAEAVRAAIREYDIDTIVNFAAETHVDRSILDPDAFVRTNMVGPYVLCEAVKDLKLERLHHVSSVTGDTPLLVRDERSSEVALRPIEMLDGEDLRHYSVLTVDADEQVRFMRMRDFIKHPVDELYEIKYSGGGSVRATAEHSVFVFDGLDIIAKPSSDIQPGDLLITFLGNVEQQDRKPHCFDFRSLLADYEPEWLSGSLEHRRTILALAGEPVLATGLLTKVTQQPAYRVINEFIDEGHLVRVGGLYHVTKDGLIDAASNMVTIRWNMVKRKLHLPCDRLEVTPLLMRIFGLYVAEGHASHTAAEQKRHLSSITFTIARDERDELDLLERCAEELGIHAYVQERESTIQVSYTSRWVHCLFRQFGATADTKQLPSWLWTQPRELIQEFFHGYEGDARIRPDGSRCFTSINRELIEQLVWLGRLNNINTRMNRRVVQQIAGVVPPGCTVTRSRTFFDLAVSAENARADESGTWRSPLARCLPAQPIRAALRTSSFAQSLRRKKLVSKRRLIQEAANGRQLPERILQLANSSIGVAEVRSVERITGDFMVYDVSVPGAERFFGGNVPVLLHNTDEVYGPIPVGQFKETDRFKPTSPYAAAKAGGELLTLSYFMTYNLPITVTRGVNTYGPYQYPEKQIPLFVTNAIDDLPLPLYGDGHQVRDRLYALDHARAIDVVLHKGRLGEAYNVSADMERTNIEVTELMLEILEKPRSLIQPILDRPAHDVRYALDSSKLRSLGWRPEVDFDTGFAQTVYWYQQNQDWWRPLKSGEYLEYYRRQYTDRAQTLKDEVGSA